MTGGYTILDLGGNVFTVGETEEKAEGKTVEGIFSRIYNNSINKPFLLENYSFLEHTEERARFVDFSEVSGSGGRRFEATFYTNLNRGSADQKLILCVMRVRSNDTVEFFKYA